MAVERPRWTRLEPVRTFSVSFMSCLSYSRVACVCRWPFVTGFALTGFLILKVSSGITEEQLKASKFSNSKAAHH